MEGEGEGGGCRMDGEEQDGRMYGGRRWRMYEEDDGGGERGWSKWIEDEED